jgi:hypothetical protein
MHTYADESGNTGSNLLDPAQPDYFAGAVMALESLDGKYSALFSEYAKSRGHSHLHAGEMGMGKLIDLFPKLERLIKRDTLRFFLGRVNKRWFILAKFFDLLFDPVENRAVAGHHYWVAPLRYVLLLKLHHIVREQELADIWTALMAPDFESAKTALIRAITATLSQVDKLPDERSRTIISEAFRWAIDHPEELGIKFQNKKLKLSHYPNVAVLTPLLGAVQRQAEFWKTQPRMVTHDQSSQFQSTWRELHGTLTRAESLEFSLVGGPVHKLGISNESAFVIGDSRTSAGIQFIDIILWLWKRAHAGADLPKPAESLLAKAFQYAEPYEMTYEGTVRLAEMTLAPIMAKQPTADELARGHELLDEFEAKRIASMRELSERATDAPSSGR